MIDGLSTVLYSSLFLLPGGIITSIMRSFVPERKLSSGQEMLRWIGYSILNNAVWSWLFTMRMANQMADAYSFWVCLTSMVLVTSVITGSVIGIIKQKNIPGHIARKLKISIEHPVPTAWQYSFCKRNTCFVIVTLDDDRRFYGYYGTVSMASSDIENEDIYLEYIYELDDDENWILVEGRDGVWISSSHITSIEFIEEVQGNERQ